jgi:DNA-binding MarR family transcriptional regulator
MKTMRAPAGVAPRTDQIEVLLAEFRRLSLGSTAAWSSRELTLTQLRALGFVQLSGSLTVSALSSALGMSVASGSALSDRLVRMDLLQRHHDPEDRRQVLLELTPAGTRFLRRIEDRARTRMRKALSVMTAHERESFETALGAFNRVMRDQAVAAK